MYNLLLFKYHTIKIRFVFLEWVPEKQVSDAYFFYSSNHVLSNITILLVSLIDYEKTLYNDVIKSLRTIFFHLFHTRRCLFQPTIPADPPIIYHATVVAPAKFVELDDVSNLKNHLGKNRATSYFIKLIQQL